MIPKEPMWLYAQRLFKSACLHLYEEVSRFHELDMVAPVKLEKISEQKIEWMTVVPCRWQSIRVHLQCMVLQHASQEFREGKKSPHSAFLPVFMG